MKPRSHPGTVFSCCRLKKSSSPQNPAMPVRPGFGFQTRALEKRRLQNLRLTQKWNLKVVLKSCHHTPAPAENGLQMLAGL